MKKLAKTGPASRGHLLAPMLTGLLWVSGWSGPTAADTAVQTYALELTRCSAQLPLPDGTTECDLEPYFVACLSEFVVGEYHILGRYQEFATPSGTAHIRDNWQVTSLLSGVSSGRSWYAAGAAPFSANDAGASTFSAAGNLIYKPLAEGPTWQEKFLFTSTQNASGDVVVESARSNYKCLGASQ